MTPALIQKSRLGHRLEDIELLGVMDYAGPLSYLRGTKIVLFYYGTSPFFGPGVGIYTHRNYLDATQELLLESVGTEPGPDERPALDPHIEEAFRRARKRRLIGERR